MGSESPPEPTLVTWGVHRKILLYGESGCALQRGRAQFLIPGFTEQPCCSGTAPRSTSLAEHNYSLRIPNQADIILFGEMG